MSKDIVGHREEQSVRGPVTFVIDDEVSMRLALAHTTLHSAGAWRELTRKSAIANWRSTLRHEATAKRRWEHDIVRLLTLRKWVGTAFGTARLVGLASAPP
jgi:hypothetical protein